MTEDIQTFRAEVVLTNRQAERQTERTDGRTDERTEQCTRDWDAVHIFVFVKNTHNTEVNAY